ncbi:hypothetical protein C6Y62_08290 [Hyphomicrobium sulfonivorans]|nr:hypothetical protein [Hyphomicrobium sulfonivorans]
MRAICLFVLGGIALIVLYGPSAQTRTKRAEMTANVGVYCERGSHDRCTYPTKKLVTRDDWGDKWPLTVDHATLVCAKAVGSMGQLIVIEGTPFAANGSTIGYVKKHGTTLQVDEKTVLVEPFDVDENSKAARLWAPAVRPDYIDADVPWIGRVDWSPIINELKAMGCGH